jgi:hypothetical protein
MRVLSFGNPSGWRDQMTFRIRRREFISLPLGAAAAWPLAARAIQFCLFVGRFTALSIKRRALGLHPATLNATSPCAVSP